MHTIRINPLALEDLQEIKKYITKELENRGCIKRSFYHYCESYEKLKEFPMLGGELAAKINIPTDFRYLISGSYLVFTRWIAATFPYIAFYTLNEIILQFFLTMRS